MLATQVPVRRLPTRELHGVIPGTARDPVDLAVDIHLHHVIAGARPRRSAPKESNRLSFPSPEPRRTTSVLPTSVVHHEAGPPGRSARRRLRPPRSRRPGCRFRCPTRSRCPDPRVVAPTRPPTNTSSPLPPSMSSKPSPGRGGCRPRPAPRDVRHRWRCPTVGLVRWCRLHGLGFVQRRERMAAATPTPPATITMVAATMPNLCVEAVSDAIRPPFTQDCAFSPSSPARTRSTGWLHRHNPYRVSANRCRARSDAPSLEQRERKALTKQGSGTPVWVCRVDHLLVMALVAATDRSHRPRHRHAADTHEQGDTENHEIKNEPKRVVGPVTTCLFIRGHGR